MTDVKITQKGKKKINNFIRGRVESAARTSRRIVPVDDGDLQASISVYQGDQRGSWILGSDKDYASLVEFGTSDQEPQPFMRPAMRELGKR